MDTSYNYPQLFDIDDTTFDTYLFHGLNLSDNPTISSPSHMYNVIDKKLLNDTHNNNHHHNEDIYNSLAANSNSYLHYLQSTTSPNIHTNNNNTPANNNNNNNYFYDSSAQMMMMIPPTMDLVDYDYLNQQQTTDQKQQYNWLYDPIDTFSLTHHHQQGNLFCDDTMVSQVMNQRQQQQQQLDSIMSENMDETITVEGGMSRGYVSLSDVNSFVAKADSIKHSSFLQLPSELMNDFSTTTQQHGEFSSSESTTNEDSEDDYSDSENELQLRWPMLKSSFSTPTTTTNNNKQKLMIKIKKPSNVLNTSALPSPYGEHLQWGDVISPKQSKSANISGGYRNKYRKSMSNIFGAATSSKKKANKLLDNTKRRGSAPHKLTINHNHSSSSLGSLHSSSSLSSLSNNLQRSMRVSDSINSFLSRHSSDEEEEAHEEDEEEDGDDDEYQIRSANAPNQIPTKKGRNVDKACNHCKRSHLRCDDMRPCRRCVATGKTGCKDVQHKPRGRPKLHKK